MHFHTFYLSSFIITFYIGFKQRNIVCEGGEQRGKETLDITENCPHCLDEETGPDIGQGLPKETPQGGVQGKKPRFPIFQYCSLYHSVSHLPLHIYSLVMRMLTFNKEIARYFSSKMSLFGNSNNGNSGHVV